MTVVDKKVGLAKFTKFIEIALIILSIGLILSLLFSLSDGAQSIWDYLLYRDGLNLLIITTLVFLILYLKVTGLHLQSVFALLRRPVLYVVLLSFLGIYLLGTYAEALFEIRFKLSQQALENFANHPVLDHERSTVQWVGLFPLREVDIAGTSVRMIVSDCHLFDDCGFVYSPDGEPPVIGEDSYTKIPFAENWYYWWRSW